MNFFAYFFALLLTSVTSLQVGWAEPIQVEERSKLLGLPLVVKQFESAESVELATGDTTLETGVQSQQSTQVSFLGKIIQLVKNKLQTLPETVSEQGLRLFHHELYLGGLRIWATNLNFEQGALTYRGGIAPTQIRVPVVAYPIGPVMLRVDAGLEFEGLLNIKVMPGISVPIRDSSLVVNTNMHFYAAGFVDAYAQFFILRAGMGGRIHLIDANLGYHAFVYINGTKPQTMSTGTATFLSGRVLGFVDYRLASRNWRRLLGRDFFNWKGKCLSFTGGVHACQ
jgi:hypothetical protein